MKIWLLIPVLIIFLGYLFYYKRYLKEKNKTHQYVKTVRGLSIINEYVSSLNSTLNREEVYDIIVDKVRELLKAKRSAIILVDGERITDFYSSLGPTGHCKQKVCGTLKDVVFNLTTVRLDNITTHESFAGFPPQHPEISSVVMVPIILRGEPIGVLIAADKKTEKGFSAEDEDLLLQLAFHAALALEKISFYEELRNLASVDGLTGLYNHRTFQERLKEEVERAKRFGHPVALLMMDIDRFKRFNDTYGHLTGDEILKKIGSIIKSCIRSIDFPARYGGEEFALILPEVSLDGAMVVAERIRNEVEKCRIDCDGKTTGVTISIGVATFPDDALSRDELIDRADKALYFAKRIGRNRVCAYREERHEEQFNGHAC